MMNSSKGGGLHPRYGLIIPREVEEMIGSIFGWLFKKEKEVPIDDRWSIPSLATISTPDKAINPLKNRIRVPPKGNGTYSFDIVGESKYQDALKTISGRKTREGKEFRCNAQVVPEPGNVHDSNAVAVKIDSLLVGYFNRVDAKDYMDQLRASGATIAVHSVAAMIVGGFKTREKEGHYGVKLDITRHS
jgi:hypothetical protein